MPILLYRVDERLIHGQVVLGWGARLNAGRYVVVDDHVAASDWEQELYRLSLDERAAVRFASTAEALTELTDWQAEEARTMLLTRDIETMLALAEGGGLQAEEVNLGGIHHARGRVAVKSYLHLDEADRERLRRLAELGVRVSGRDLPGSLRVGLESLVNP
jgi:PTS system mannose-specific IIB component/fructoselysine and glucoselysine-specific PTS system IIB component